MSRRRPTVCVGMATYDDFDGVWFTVQSICMYQREVLPDLSFVVVDNHPGGRTASALRGLADHVANYRYVPFAGFTGTAVRDLVFREADADIVCCLDSHVLLGPGALAALQRWFMTHPASLDLLQGPIVWDDLCHGTTHMEPTWRDGMFGVWGTVPELPDPAADPFEIEMHGLGLFACRRDAWPGINPRFRGFGGEEGYLHEKFRQQGGRVLCHPGLRWAHRFGRPDGPAYPNLWEDRVRNYILGWSELGWDLEPVERHFRAHLGAGADSVWRRASRQVEHPVSAFDGVFCLCGDTGGCSSDCHSESLAWRSERVVLSPAQHPELRRIEAWRRALREAKRRGHGGVLLLEAGPPRLEPSLVHELLGQTWRACALGDGAVAVHQSAFAQVLDDLGEDDAGARRLLSHWGDFDGYLLQLTAAARSPMRFGGSAAKFAGAGDRPRAAQEIALVEREDGVLVRRVPSGREYELNSTGALVLSLCDGTRTIPQVADVLARRFALGVPPLEDVTRCVRELSEAGIVELGSGYVRPARAVSARPLHQSAAM